MISLDVIITMLLSINGTFTCCIQVMSTTQFLHPMSPSSMYVYTQDNASLQSTYLIMLVLLVKLFSSYDTHVSCHVMFYIITCHCIIQHVILLYAVICMYLGSNSYSVHCSTDAHLAHHFPAAPPLDCCATILLLLIIILYINRFLKMYIIIYIRPSLGLLL